MPEFNGTGGNDVLIGTAGSDTIFGGLGVDDLQGLSGDDLYIFWSGDEHLAAEITDTSGYDTIEFRSLSASTLTLYAGDTGIDRVTIGAGTQYQDDVNIDAHLLGNALNIVGGAGSNWLIGTAFNDTINGGADPDRVTGGLGADVLTGGTGYDIFADTAAGLNGDTITDFGYYESIVITDATLAGFTFSLSGNTLSYTGGSLTLSAPVYGQVVATAAAGGGVQLSIGPALVPAWPDAPGAPNTDPIYGRNSASDPLPDYTISNGDYRYLSVQWSSNLFPWGLDTLTNAGTIYMEDVPGFYGDMGLSPGVYPVAELQNSGTIVVHAHTDIAGNVLLLYDTGSGGLGTHINNSGQIFAISDHFSASAVLTWSTNTTITNSGLIAVYAPEGASPAIQVVNGADITNLAGGQILSEGQGATGILATFDLNLTNAGLIEAWSLSSSGLAVGVYADVGTVTNSGTISGDISVYIDGTLTNSGTLNGAVLADEFLTFNNQATGILNGNFIGGESVNDQFYDIVTNAGVINGNVALFAGNDQFTNSGAGQVAGYVDLGEGNDQFTGGSHSDEVYGGGGNDTLTGNGGDDFLEGGAGNDALNGGAGFDAASYSEATAGVAVSLAVVGAQDTIGAGTDTLTGIEDLVGSAYNDTLTGDGTGNIIIGGGGADTLIGGGGSDFLEGDAGGDTFQGTKAGLNGDTIADLQAGDKIVITDAALAGFTFNLTGNALTYTGGSLTLQGSLSGHLVASAAAGGGVQLTLQEGPTEGDDALTGTESADTISGLGGNDTIIGLGGDDTLNGGEGNDNIDGGAGRDQIHGGNGDDVIHTGSGNALFPEETWDDAGNDTVYGEADQDYFHASQGNDYYDGGTGGFLQLFEQDTIDYADASAGIVVDLRLSSNQVYSSGAGDTANIGVDTLVNIETIYGSAFDDVMTGGNAYVTLFGGTGNDTLTGGAGGAVLNGGAGNDIFFGGSASDTVSYAGSSTGVRVSLAISGWQDTAGAGSDSINGIENLEGSSHDDILTGNDQANWIYGAGGNDILFGGAGNDELHGEYPGGSGVYIGGTGNDSIFTTESGFDDVEFNLGDGQDKVYDLGSGDIVNIYGYSSAQSISLVNGDVVVKLSDSDQITFRFSDLATVQSALHFVNGTSGNDILTGGPGDDTLHGSDGTDTLNGVGGNDHLFGDNGDDTLNGGDGNDVLDGGTQNDSLFGGAGDDLLISSVGGMGGMFETDILDGGSGNDTVSYAGVSTFVSVDLAIAGAQETGGGGNDTFVSIENLIGSDVADNFLGNADANILEGGLGDDYLNGRGGIDTASYAGASNGVVVSLAIAGFQATGGGGSDLLVNMENLTGSGFDDALTGDSGNNVLTGLAGNDILNGGAGADTMIGGFGDDKYYVTDAGDVVVEAAGEGDDSLFVLGTYTLAQGVSIETLVALNQSSTDPLVLTGNEYGQSLYGNLGDNYLNGGQGNDHLVGLAGNDNLLGGTGADHMEGGVGNDVYYVDEAGDLVTELNGEGNDIVVATASYTLGAGASIETMSADPNSGNINLTGNELAQSLYGNSGNNILTGGGGADYLVGGAGNDKYYVDTSDFIGENVGGGDDWIFVATSYTLREGNEIETLVAVNQDSTDPVDFTGNEFGQSLYGSQGVNHLDGGAGNDYLVGLGGNDFLVGGAGNDNLDGGQGNDLYYVDAGDHIFEAAGQGDDLAVAFESFTLGAGQSVETLSAAEGSSNINLTGNELAQSIYGNAGANILTTGGGADYLVGGAGNDTFVLTNAAGVATIADYAAGDVVDISQFLSVANGTNIVTGGYVKIVGTQLMVDVSGGADSWVTIGNVSGSGSVMIRYASGGSPADLSVARSVSQESQSSGVAMAVAAAGLVAEPIAARDANSDTASSTLAVADGDAVPHHAALIPAMADHGAQQLTLARPTDASAAEEPAHAAAKPTHAVQTELDVSHSAAPSSLPASEAQADTAGAPAAPAIAAHGIMLPAAKLVAVMDASGANDQGQHGHLVGRILAEALHGGNPLDTLLASLPGHEGNAPLAQLAQPGTADFEAGHGILAAAGPSGHDMLMSHLAFHTLATHPDAPAVA